LSQRSRRLRVPALAVVVCAAIAAIAATTSAAASPRATLAGSVPSWATASNFKSAAASTDSVGFRVYLGWRNAAQAEALARAVSDPASSSYGQYVTPGQFRQQFAPTQSDVNAVQSWLRSQGFTIDYTPTNNHYVEAEGTVAQAQAAFGVQLNEYSYSGQTLRAPATALSVPSSLAGTVDAVIGLDQSQALVHPYVLGADAPPSAGFRNAPPCSAYWAQQIASQLPGSYPYAPCGHTPAQIRGAYGLAGSGLDGSGQTVAIIDAYASPTIVQDVNRYSRDNGLPQLSSSNFTQVVAPGTFHHPESLAQDPQGWYGEETLDVEAVHGVAPKANIVYIGAPNNYSDLDSALNHLVDRGLAQIVTNSYGYSGEALPPGYIKPYNDTFIQAAAEGIGVYFSSGDSGDETNGGANPQNRSTDWPASSPWVTSVGGTSLGVSATNGYVGETGWSTLRSRLAANGKSWLTGVYQYGGGGGVSRLFAEPSYQVNAGIDSASFGWGWSGRVVPDISMVGDPNTGYLVGQTQTFPDGTYYDTFRLGGTSLSSPLFAAVMALADQAAGRHHGFANPALYAAGAAAYRDVVDPSSALGGGVVRNDYVNGVDASSGIRTTLRSLGYEGSLIHATTGYDDMTGLGSPNGASFLSALSR
jgi:subtilase family serine protease